MRAAADVAEAHPFAPLMSDSVEPAAANGVADGGDDVVCDICFEPTLGAIGKLKDTALLCRAGHATCFECVRKILKTKSYRCSIRCSGTRFECPFCRANSCIDKTNYLGLALNSHLAARASLCCEACATVWEETVYESDEDEDEDDVVEDDDDDDDGSGSDSS